MRFTGDIPCPYCGRPVPRTVLRTEDTNDLAEHCDVCFLPFDVAPDSTAIGQDDPRYGKDLT